MEEHYIHTYEASKMKPAKHCLKKGRGGREGMEI
jgi:hypothetical protein